MRTGNRISAFLLAVTIAASFALAQGIACAKDPQAPRLKKILVGDTPLWVEVADTLEKQERGLMFRRSLPDNEGMLFIYKEPIEMSFWMRNTFLPLDIAFIGADGRILNIHQARPLDDSVLYRSAGAAKYVIETNQGWFSRHGIGPGDRVTLR
ncbi:MAG: hypothetical protein A4E67_01722 [Syntrophaceae bacterium PtaB.Bin038]|nr:MAG: hypothetical protein A4E67_01722 [Syntrophaceae bacterium PtaB.Bin038]